MLSCYTTDSSAGEKMDAKNINLLGSLIQIPVNQNGMQKHVSGLKNITNASLKVWNTVWSSNYPQIWEADSKFAYILENYDYIPP